MLLYGSLLLATKGLPYGIDNNESFSSLWHARHLYDTSFAITKGLADDVYAWHPAANPYVHTHQGNIPRFFAFLIYLFGARTIESQIVITTFSIGILSTWFAFRFLCSLGSPTYALLGCLILVTDYGLFGQWQVDTYRVWYGFFFFGALLWVTELGARPSPTIFVVGALGFAATFYGEYVFATFVGIVAALYACFRYCRNPRILLRAWLGVTSGAAIAACVLTLQLVGYMGWKNMKLDVAYTLAARNMASDHTFTEMVDKFYREHRIVFWHNYFDVATFRNLSAFGLSILQKHLQFYGKWISLSAIVVSVGGLLGLIPKGEQTNEWDGRSHPVGSWSRTLLSRVLPGMAAILFAYFVLHRLGPLFTQPIIGSPSLPLNFELPPWFGWSAYFISSIFAVEMAYSGMEELGSKRRLSSLLCFGICVFASYAIVYRLFTGYIFSGYLVRQAPFLVFCTDVLLAGAVYVVFEYTRRALIATIAYSAPVILPFAGSILLACFCGAWVSLQLTYLTVVPPNGEPFLKLLAKPPFRGGSFVVNDYPAPEAEQAHSWAYAESSIFSGQIQLGPRGFFVEHDKQYLWFADADNNPAYMKPDFGLLIRHPSSLDQALNYYREQEAQPHHEVAFVTTGLVRRTQEPLQAFFQDKLLRSDGSTYSIVKFDWDFPPFLRPVDTAMRMAASAMSLEQKIAISETSQEQRRRWRVEIDPSDQRSPNTKNLSVVLTGSSIDGRPIFSETQLSKAGWSRAERSAGETRPFWVGKNGVAQKVSAVVVGDNVALNFLEGPERGAAVVSVNDMSQKIAFNKPTVSEHDISFSISVPRDKFTVIPDLSPGTYVNTWLHNDPTGSQAVFEFKYAHQEGLREEATTVRLYHQKASGDWELYDVICLLGQKQIPVRLDEFRQSNGDTLREFRRVVEAGDKRTYTQWLSDHLEAFPGERRRNGLLRDAPLPDKSILGSRDSVSEIHTMPIPRDLEGRFQISVTPGTRTKDGPEYFGLSFYALQKTEEGSDSYVPVGFGLPRNFQKRDFPYGYLKLRLRFPADKPTQAEPIVIAGVEGAADILYLVYADATHIRIGFDHWFKGGPMSDPISIDYSKVHELEVSMGSLFPPQDDIVFAGMDPKGLARIKDELRVALDGKTVLRAPSDFWDSPPSQVVVGRNDINASTCNPLFHGVILECKRIWPKIP